MKITERLSDFDEDLDDFRTWEMVVENEGYVINDLCVTEMTDCPEDATLNRDLGFVYEIRPLLKLAYQMGKRGEEIKFDYIED